MQKTYKSAIKLTILLFIGILILYVVFKGQDFSKIWKEVKVANPFWILLSLAFNILANIVRALRWQMLYKSIGYKNIKFLNILSAIFVGYLANLALPRFGELVRCKAIEDKAKIPLFLSLGTVITERLFDVLVLFIAIIILFVFQFNFIEVFFYQNFYQPLSAKLSTSQLLLLITGCCLLLVIVAGFFLLFFKGRLKRKLLKIYMLLKEGVTSYQKLNKKALFFVYTSVIWGFYILSVFAAFYALESTAQLNFGAAFTTMVFSSVSMAAPIQGGIGVFHWMVAKCLLLYGVAFTDGLAYATLVYGIQLVPIVVFGGIGFYISFSRKSKSV